MVFISRKGLQDETLCLSQLGTFSKLPIEIRLSIWEAIFPNIKEPKYFHSKNIPPTPIVSLLCCSRFLYHEISIEIYKNLKFSIAIRDSDRMIRKYWMKFEVFSKKLHATQEMIDKIAARRRFSRFPFSKVQKPHFEIRIEPPKTRDAAPIFQLWLKINSVISFFDDLSYPPYVHVRFMDDWLQDGLPRHSIHLAPLRMNGYWVDHDILILPFTCLSKWHYTLPADLSDAIRDDPDALKQTRLHQFKLEDSARANEVDTIYTALDIAETSRSSYVYTPREVYKVEKMLGEAFWTIQEIMEILRSRYIYSRLDNIFRVRQFIRP